eukprot:1320921-Rhodomonas_salina.2
MPSLVVFDLDATLWTPELYQLRKLPGYKDASDAVLFHHRGHDYDTGHTEGPGPVANKDVKLFDGAKVWTICIAQRKNIGNMVRVK